LRSPVRSPPRVPTAVRNRRPTLPPPPEPPAQKAPKEKPPPPPPAVLQLSLPELPVMEEFSLAPDVLALTLSGPPRLLNGSQQILATLLDEEEASVIELKDDPDWKIYPEIGEAWKEAGGEEYSLCLAISPTRNTWAIGVASKGKVREPAARLALAVAHAVEADPGVFGEIVGQFPEFFELCRLAETVPAGFEFEEEAPPEEQAPPAEQFPVEEEEEFPPEPAFLPPPPKRRRAARAASPDHEEDDESGSLMRTTARIARAATAAEERKAAGAIQWGKEPLPRDKPFMIQLPEDAEIPPALDGLLADAVVMTTDGTKRKGLYSHADEAIRSLLPELGVAEADIKGAVKYEDDANWKVFPSIGEALKKMSPVEECLCVAICAEVGVWAVGVGMKGKSRYAAAKAALVGALGLAAAEASAEVDFSEDLPMIADYIEEVKAAREEFQEA